MKSDKQEKRPPIPLHIVCEDIAYNGLARPLESSASENTANAYDIFLEEANIKGTIYKDSHSKWHTKDFVDKNS